MSLGISFEPGSVEGQPPHYLSFVRVVELLIVCNHDTPTTPGEAVEQIKEMAAMIVGYPGCAEHLTLELNEWLTTVELGCEQSRILL